MASLPVEIIIEIFRHLPVKSLIRFLCVAKSWYSLIKNSNFIKLHVSKTLISNPETYLILSQEHPSFLYVAYLNLECIHSPISFSKLHKPLRNDYAKVIGSCNGILCISSDSRDGNIVLYNPLTKSGREFLVRHIRCLPKYHYRIYGFGYDSVTDDYKFFYYYCASNQSEDHVRGLEVFSFKNNSWKSVEVIDFKINSDQRAVYLNDAMYFVAYSVEFFPDLNYEWFKYFIVKFDLRSDTMTCVEFPQFVDRLQYEMSLELSVLNGCLCLLVSKHSYGKIMLRADLWMMKECGEGEPWVRLFTICDPKGIAIELKISTLVCSKDGRRILLAVDSYKLGWYDLDNGYFETITACGFDDLWPSSFCYISGSLVSLVQNES